MKISLFASNLAANSTGRVLLLAQALAADHKVKIIGPCFGAQLWQPAQGTPIPISLHEGERFPRFASTALKMAREADGDVLIACKPRMPSLGTALVARRMRSRPVIVDFDDDEEAMTHGGASVPLIRKLRDPLGRTHTRIALSLIRFTDGCFCVSEPYRRRYGGVVVPHGKDLDVVDPQRFDGSAIRKQLGFSEHDYVAGFVGTPRPHKGVGDLLAAIELLSDPGIKLLLVGAEPDDEYVMELTRRYPASLKALPPQPMELMPRYLAAVDVVVLPQRDVPAARGQVPAKLFDAMAMAKPIVATSVGEVPDVLSDCGLLVAPGDLQSLAHVIRRLRSDPPWAAALGQKARRRCAEKYSYSVMRAAMNEEIERALRTRGARATSSADASRKAHDHVESAASDQSPRTHRTSRE